MSPLAAPSDHSAAYSPKVLNHALSKTPWEDIGLQILRGWYEIWAEKRIYVPPGRITDNLVQVCVILEGLSFFGPPEWISSVGCFPLTTSFQSLFHQPLNNNVYLKFWKWKKSRFFPQASKCLLWQFVYCPVHLDHRIHVDEVKALDLMRFYRMRTFHLGKWLLGEPLKISLLMQQCKLL